MHENRTLFVFAACVWRLCLFSFGENVELCLNVMLPNNLLFHSDLIYLPTHFTSLLEYVCFSVDLIDNIAFGSGWITSVLCMGWKV